MAKLYTNICILAASLLLSGCASSSSSTQSQTVADFFPLVQGQAIGEVHFPEGDTEHGGQGQVIDEIPPSQMEETNYHVHAHVSLFVNGKQIMIPKGIGIMKPWVVENNFIRHGNSLYWLHTHDSSGIIHIESPVETKFTLGNFFDIWGKPLNSDNIAGFQGPVHVYVNTVPFSGDPRNIVLKSHEEITLEVGTPVVAPPVYSFPPELFQ
ncbi:hypothetical protein LSG31_17325 [Fodinisporobacter ferrooxydans]|uniref:Uncharacterized protein n=1 Tax=Fodinisporobacter ferrooxydans TaxID=2901836 RepID=A0ABY4CGH9_9BACL|nr:hypothetical protein LSG31_17325 [Alicyclobacillaceae bacterium MYW30-H2]